MSLDENDGDQNWVLGVVLGLLGSIAINTGNNIQSLGLKNLQQQIGDDENVPELARRVRRKSTLTTLLEKKKTVPITDEEVPNVEEQIKEKSPNDHKNEDEITNPTSPCTSMTWLFGTFVFVAGSLLNFASYAFAAQSLLASLESIQFVTNLIFGKFMLGANVTRTMLLGTALTVLGTIVAVQFSSKETLDLNTEEVKALYFNPAYISYLVLVVGMLFLLHFIYRYYEKRKTNQSQLPHTDFVMPITYSIWSALFGTQSVVQAKVLAELLAVHSDGEEDIFHSWFTYFTLFFWLVTVGVWLKRLNDALSKFDPLFIIPLLQCSFIFFAIVSGGIFFQEFNGFTSLQWLGFWFGVAVMFGGLIMLTPKNKSDEESIRKEVANLLFSSGCANEKQMFDETKATFGNENIRTNNFSTPPPSPMTAVSKLSDKENSPSSYVIVPQLKSNAKVAPEQHTNPDPQCLYIDNTSKQKNRHNRPSLSRSAVDTVKDVVYESANILLTPHNGTGAMTDAMVAATVRRDQKRKRKDQIARLRSLLSDCQHHSDIISDELQKLVKDLELDASSPSRDQSGVNQTGTDSSISAVERCSNNISPRAYKRSILKKANELEKTLDDDSEHSRENLDKQFEGVDL